jgi:hypothetical protein
MAEGNLSQTPTIVLLRATVSACATTSWSTAAVRTPPFETMCDGLDPVGGYLICRTVQVQNQETLAAPSPPAPESSTHSISHTTWAVSLTWSEAGGTTASPRLAEAAWMAGRDRSSEHVHHVNSTI